MPPGTQLQELALIKSRAPQPYPRPDPHPSLGVQSGVT